IQLDLLKKDYSHCRFITFPNYDSPSGQIVTNYLEGKYREENNTVSAYTASCFYAVDRYTSYKTDWEKDYLAETPIFSARYVSSNAIYQMTKLPRESWDEYMEWLFDTEYGKFVIPRPTGTIFLDMPVVVSRKLLLKRYNGDEKKLDIHESNLEFMSKCREAAMYVAEKENWRIIKCSTKDEPLPVDVIHNNIKKEIEDLLK
ncbi:MAG: thymidylate kinase, partial [Ruminiclostridium sp.]|nr:thymidylate kinase [Ruminiclostridium sp.]